VSSIFHLPGISDLLKREERNKVYGVVCAIVTKIDDDQGRYMVRVRFVNQPNGSSAASPVEVSAWCRIITFGAGKTDDKRGWYGLPEIDDEVLVAFENGDVNRPVIVGSLWNNDAKPIKDNKDGKNNDRWFKSRSGHILRFCDDKDGKKEQVEILSAKGAQVLLDDTDQGFRVHIQDQKKENYLTLDQQAKKITLESSTGDILIKAKGTITLEANKLETVSKSDTKMEAKTWSVKAGDSFTIDGGGTGDVIADGNLNVIGSKVNIN
jgi:uncharacterized protein involved in type VI secretion and phage assembly